MSKNAYTPHRSLETKIVPSKTDYDRTQNDDEINEQLSDLDPTNQMESDAFFNAEGDIATAQEMYEHGFSIIMPETK